MTVRRAVVRTEHLDPDQGPGMSAFARALRSGEGEALRFLPAAPRDEAGWSALMVEAAAAAPPVPKALAERLAERQRELGAGPGAVSNALRLADSDNPALAVVTGQQPGLFGGPLLTFHKAAGAISLARRLDGLGGRSVVPVFWLASEDHDFDEMNRSLVIDRAGQARSLKLKLESDGRSAMDIPLPEGEVAEVLHALKEALPDTERAALTAALTSRRPDEDFPSWAIRTLLQVFGDSGLVIVEPPLLIPWVGETYAWLLDEAETIREAVDETGQALQDAGLPAPLFPQAPDATPLFYRAETGARRLRVGLGSDGEIRLREGSARFSRAELREILRREPERGSGNVVGRVFVQNRHLPTLAYIAGPTEIAYHAQVRAAAERLGLFFPLALPRPEATWVDAKTSATLDIFDRKAADILAGAVSAPEADDADIAAALALFRRHLAERPPEFEALLERGGRGAAALKRTLERLAATWEKGAGSVEAAFQADSGVGQARWVRMLASLRPHGRPQERLLSPLSLIARYGPELVRLGLLSLDPLPPVHHLLHLSEENVSS